MQYALDPKLLPPGGVPVQCTRCGHVFTAAPPAKATTQSTQLFASPVPSIAPVPAIAPLPSVAPARAPAAKPAAPKLNSTLVYGTGKGPAPAPGATQAFGAVPPKPQAAPAVTPPPSRATQVFGAVPQPSPAPPAAPKPPPAKPPAGAAPAPMATQAFGAVPQPSAAAPAVSATQVFGAVPQPAPVPPKSQAPAVASSSVTMTELFGDLSDFEPDVDVDMEGVGARPAPPTAVSPPAAKPPGLMPRIAPQAPAAIPSKPASEPVVAVAATTPIELPEEILEQLNRPLSELMAEGSSSADKMSSEALGPAPVPGPGSGPSAPGLSKPLELPPELLDAPRGNANEGRDARPSKGRGRVLLIAGSVLVIALTAFFTSPAWRGKSNAVPPEVLVAKDEAVVMLRRDDTTSQTDALSRLRTLSGTNPTSVELQTEMAIALAMNLDDTRVLATTLEARVKRLREQISTLSQAQTPADWQSRVNAMREEVTAIDRQLIPLQERNTTLSKQALELVKRLATAPPEEPKALTQSRQRARALLSAVLGSAETPGLAVQLAQGGQQDWSTLTMAEYVLNASDADNQLAETAAALESLREANSSFLRTYVLGARIALRRKDPAAAHALLDTVLTLNPKHELAQQLQAHAKEMASQEAAPESSSSP